MTLSQTGAAPESPVAQETRCRHHWIIEEPNGPSSWGRCKLCGSSREFLNNPEAARIDRQHADSAA